MIQIYVTEIPKKSNECPFFNANNNKCNITNEKCVITTKNKDCPHLATFFVVEEEEQVND